MVSRPLLSKESDLFPMIKEYMYIYTLNDEIHCFFLKYIFTPDLQDWRYLKLINNSGDWERHLKHFMLGNCDLKVIEKRAFNGEFLAVATTLASHRRSEGCGFGSRLGLGNIFLTLQLSFSRKQFTFKRDRTQRLLWLAMIRASLVPLVCLKHFIGDLRVKRKQQHTVERCQIICSV